jgi:hypothetical protein
MSLVPSKKLWEVKGSAMMLGLKPMHAVGCRHDRLHSTRTGYQSYLFAGKNVFSKQGNILPPTEPRKASGSPYHPYSLRLGESRHSALAEPIRLTKSRPTFRVILALYTPSSPNTSRSGNLHVSILRAQGQESRLYLIHLVQVLSKLIFCFLFLRAASCYVYTIIFGAPPIAIVFFRMLIVIKITFVKILL